MAQPVGLVGDSASDGALAATLASAARSLASRRRTERSDRRSFPRFGDAMAAFAGRDVAVAVAMSGDAATAVHTCPSLLKAGPAGVTEFDFAHDFPEPPARAHGGGCGRQEAARTRDAPFARVPGAGLRPHQYPLSPSPALDAIALPLVGACTGLRPVSPNPSPTLDAIALPLVGACTGLRPASPNPSPALPEHRGGRKAGRVGGLGGEFEPRGRGS